MHVYDVYFCYFVAPPGLEALKFWDVLLGFQLGFQAITLDRADNRTQARFDGLFHRLQL